MMRNRLLLLVPLLLAGCGARPAREWEMARTPDGLRYAIMGPAGDAAGLVLLLGLPDHAELPRLLADRGLAAVVPPVDANSMYLDLRSLDDLEAVLADARSRTGSPPNRIVAGGISLGGTGAVRYAQHCAVGRCDTTLAVSGVFAVDAPLDMERLWRSATHLLRRRWEGSNLQETQWIVDRLLAKLGGPPQERRAAYVSRSAFSYFEPRGGNARLLMEIPVRLYAEPDIEFWIRESRFDYYNLNAFDAAGLVNRLLIGGNAAAELVTTSGKGVRPDGRRNPHSWSIVDEPDLVRWIVETLSAAAVADPTSPGGPR